MDFTRKYIKMCEKAREIQEKWRPRVGDWVVDVWNKERPLVISAISDDCNYLYLLSQLANSKDDIYLNHISKVFCIFTQDQLQERVTDKGYFRVSLIELFYRFANKNIDKHTSMEQLCLAYVMWVKYKKIWDEDKEKWIKKE